MNTNTFENSPASKDEIETFERRHLAILPLVLGILNVGGVGYMVATRTPIRGDSLKLLSLYALFGSVHVFYTLAFLLAPRFLFRGTRWLKALPWIISSLALFFIFYVTKKANISVLIYCLVGFALQLLQFIVCVLPTESFLSDFFMPFRILKVKNMLAKIDLTDPNANLETAYGPPVQVPSPIHGQAPTIIRYGSQARNVLRQQSGEISVDESVPVNPIYHQAEKPTSGTQPSSTAPPAYTSNLPSYDSDPNSRQNGKAQYTEKK